jgi:hypothetical protein
MYLVLAVGEINVYLHLCTAQNSQPLPKIILDKSHCLETSCQDEVKSSTEGIKVSADCPVSWWHSTAHPSEHHFYSLMNIYTVRLKLFRDELITSWKIT